MSGATKRPPDQLNCVPSKVPKMTPEAFNRMKVCVRVRPLSDKEQTTENIIDVIDTSLLVYDPYMEARDTQYSYRGKQYNEIGKKANKNLQFNFDRVFDTNEDNITVYRETTKDLVASLLSGYNCSVFAYGSTGSGKTHTMLGSSTDPGIIFFTMMDLYKKLEEDENKNLELSISYFEIYNEIFYDLLDPTSRKPLSVLEDSNKGMTVKNLSVLQPRDVDHLLEMLRFGNQNRKQHPTDSNAESSRSHAVFQITLRRKDYSAEQEMSIQVSKMSLIDLAGSERATVAYKSCRSVSLHREGGNINKSLLALGNCINALSNPKQAATYVPYRSSKLTLILRDSLGGNCQTLMIATVSPSRNHYMETHNTLVYAERTKGVQLNVHKNHVSVTVQPRDYKQIIDSMTTEKKKMLKENEELKQLVELYKSQAEQVPLDPIVSSRDAIEKLHQVKNHLDHLFAKRLELRETLIGYEQKIKKINLRLTLKKWENERITSLNREVEADEFKESSGPYHHFQQQKLHYLNEHEKTKKEVDENEDAIFRLKAELLAATNNDIVVRSYFMENDCKTQAKEVEFSKTHTSDVLKDIIDSKDADQEHIISLHKFGYRSYNVLKAQGLISEEMEATYKSLIQKAECKKSVVWKDAAQTPKKVQDLLNIAELPIYMTNDESTHSNHNLVSALEITPVRNYPVSFSGISNNMNKQPLGNTVTKKIGGTVTKGRNVAFVSPARSFPQQMDKENYSAHASHSNFVNRRTPEPQNFDGNMWSNRKNLNLRPRRQTGYFASGNSGNSHSQPTPNGKFTSQNRGNGGGGSTTPYGHNPNFRFKSRR